MKRYNLPKYAFKIMHKELCRSMQYLNMHNMFFRNICKYAKYMLKYAIFAQICNSLDMHKYPVKYPKICMIIQLAH